MQRMQLVVVALLPSTGLVDLIGRRPEAIFAAEPWAESGPIFYVPTFFIDPLSLITTPFAGYLHLSSRLIAYAERAVSPAFAPLVGTLLAFAITLAVAVFLASSRMATVLPQQWQRLAFGAALLMVPIAYEVLGIDVNAHVYLSVYFVALVVATPPSTRVGRFADIAGATLAGLSGPFSLLFAPMYWVRRHWLAPVVTASGAIQLGFLLTSPGRPLQVPDLRTVLQLIRLRLNIAVLGEYLSNYAPLALTLFLAAALLYLMLRAVPATTWGPFAYAAVAVALSGALVTGPAIVDGPITGGRYFVLTSLAVAVIVIAGLGDPRRSSRAVAGALAGLMVIGWSLSARVPAFQDGTWEARSQCIGSVEPCTIRIAPDDRFTIQWPGSPSAHKPAALRRDPGDSGDPIPRPHVTAGVAQLTVRTAITNTTGIAAGSGVQVQAAIGFARLDLTIAGHWHRRNRHSYLALRQRACEQIRGLADGVIGFGHRHAQAGLIQL